MTDRTMFELILDTPHQLATAHDLEITDMPSADNVVLTGMGGSAMAAEVGGVASDSPDVLVHVHRGYGLPAWAESRKAAVVACSYSGNTAETLDAVETALDAGLPVVAVTSGGRLGTTNGVSIVSVPPGLPPRAAMGYQSAAVIRILGGLGAAGDWRSAVDETVDVLQTLLDDGRGAAAALGRDLADAMQHALPLIAGGPGIGATAAHRWSTQLAENAKRVAVPIALPEMNHNLLEAFAASTNEPGRLGLVALRDPTGDRRIDKRFDHTLSVLGDKVQSLGEVRAQGSSALARLFSLMIVGDVASVALADMVGVDPMPVDVLEDFKRALREDDS